MQLIEGIVVTYIVYAIYSINYQTAIEMILF